MSFEYVTFNVKKYSDRMKTSENTDRNKNQRM